MERQARSAAGRAFARAGLLGNPSDAYRGKAIAFSVRNFSARVTVAPADRLVIEEERAAPLLRATLDRFVAHTGLSPAPLRISLESTIPFQAGLAGSSAIVIAALRALASAHEEEIDPFDQSELALAAEVEDLGIAAGPMDRAVQAYEGVLHMDFSRERAPSAYTAIAAASLPPMRIAWHPQGGRPSGDVHADVRARWQQGDSNVRTAMAAFPALVDDGLRALQRGDFDSLRSCVDRNFDARAALFPIAERDREMVEIARSQGAAAKQCGSGGACLAVLPDEAAAPSLEAAYQQAGYHTVEPTIEDTA